MPDPSPLFDDGRAERYDRIISRIVVGYESMHRLARAAVLLEADVRRVLVVGVGTGEEALALARDLPDAKIVGVDPSADMLALAAEKFGAAGIEGRIGLVHGQVGDAPAGPFDVACDLLVAHFVPSGPARAEHFRGIHHRLKDNGLLVESGLLSGPHEALWRSVLGLGFDAEKVEDIVQGYHEDVFSVSLEEYVDSLLAAGFGSIEQIWQALFARMWTCRRA